MTECEIFGRRAKTTATARMMAGTRPKMMAEPTLEVASSTRDIRNTKPPMTRAAPTGISTGYMNRLRIGAVDLGVTGGPVRPGLRRPLDDRAGQADGADDEERLGDGQADGDRADREGADDRPVAATAGTSTAGTDVEAHQLGLGLRIGVAGGSR